MHFAMSETVSSSLEIMGKGMLGIFLVIGIIALTVYIMTHTQRKK